MFWYKAKFECVHCGRKKTVTAREALDGVKCDCGKAMIQVKKGVITK